MMAKANLREILKDPESARFQHVFINTVTTADGRTAHIYCGEMNAKNSYGGYSGYQRFIAAPGAAAMEESTDDFEDRWSRLCDAALRPDVPFTLVRSSGSALTD